MLPEVDFDMRVFGGRGNSEAVVRWERFLPRMALRVLLVEADDSTRQIIAVLLKKCGYKVAAVSDGLEAWEVLNRRPRDFDLILTEVDLPSISGFALLTLIVEHEICWNLPVIMMSSNDLICTVHRCMLRGAADFLVKPIRRNELTTLWQHVWRRQYSSCTKLDAEAVSTCVGNSPDLPQLEQSRTQLQPDEAVKSSQKSILQENEYGESAAASTKEDANCASKACGCDNLIPNHCREAIDLIGAFENNPQLHFEVSDSNIAQNMFDSSPRLDLSLKRSHPCGSANANEKQTLSHSKTSAFSLSVNEAPQPLQPVAGDVRCNDKQYGMTARGYNSDASVSTSNARTSVISLANGHFGQPEAILLIPSLSPEGRLMTLSVPARGTSLDGLHTDSGTRHEALQPQMHCARSDPSPIQSPPANCNGDQVCFPATQAAVVGVGTANGVGPSVPQERSHLARQRSAAVDKFRLKRKDRCFEKKVRYESRTKLAEQRPRAKGQFVQRVAL